MNSQTDNAQWERIWQTEGAQYTPRIAANEFARTYWDKPRDIVKWTPTPGNAGLFQVKDGTATYCARMDGNLFVIEKQQAQTVTTVIYADGGCHGNGTAEADMYGSYRIYADGEREIGHCQLTGLGKGTNNRAEYLTLIDALKWCLGKPKPIVIYSDSQLMVNQVNGEWRVKEPSLQGLCEEAARLLKLCQASLRWVRRDEIVKRLGH